MAEFVQTQLDEGALTFEAYLALLETDSQRLKAFLSAVTVGETYFFREQRQFRFLVSHVLPELFAAFPTGSGVTLWSAACSTGEEAWSLALVADQVSREKGGRWQVVATDLHASSVEKGREGLYTGHSLREDGGGFHPLVRAASVEEPGGFRMTAEWKDKVQFRELNLAGSLSSAPSRVQLIFLRNALIYIDPAVRERILTGLIQRLTEPGYLFLSATEVPLICPAGVELREAEGVYYFARVSGSRPPAPVHRSSTTLRTLPRLPRPDPGFLGTTADPPVARVPSNRALTCFRLIDGDGLAEARTILADPTPWEDAPTIPAFLAGYADLREGRTEAAVEAFSRCLDIDSRFWLARFHRAGLWSLHRPDEARRDFLRVKTDIEALEGRDPGPVSAFLEGFDTRYFLGICDRGIAKLARTGGNRGPG